MLPVVLLSSACSLLPARPVVTRAGTPSCGFFDSEYVDPLAVRGLEMFGGGLTSRVWNLAPKPEEWQKLLFAAPHEAIRHELVRLDRALPKVQYRSKDHPSFVALARYFNEYVCAAIDYQCRLEDELLFPLISEQLVLPPAVAQREVVGKTAMREQQRWGEETIAPMREAIAQGNGQKARAKLKAFSEMLGNVLEAKERTLAPMLAENLSPEWGYSVQQQALDYAAADYFGPTMLVMSYQAAQATAMRDYAAPYPDAAVAEAVTAAKNDLLYEIITS